MRDEWRHMDPERGNKVYTPDEVFRIFAKFGLVFFGPLILISMVIAAFFNPVVGGIATVAFLTVGGFSAKMVWDNREFIAARATNEAEAASDDSVSPQD